MIGNITSLEDMKWLADVHKIDIYHPKTHARAILVIIYGNEDCPSKVELFSRDYYKAKPFRVYVSDSDGKLIEQK
jgi:hypothetical protein